MSLTFPPPPKKKPVCPCIRYHDCHAEFSPLRWLISQGRKKSPTFPFSRISPITRGPPGLSGALNLVYCCHGQTAGNDAQITPMCACARLDRQVERLGATSDTRGVFTVQLGDSGRRWMVWDNFHVIRAGFLEADLRFSLWSAGKCQMVTTN